jgi:hypothetical protein
MAEMNRVVSTHKVMAPIHHGYGILPPFESLTNDLWPPVIFRIRGAQWMPVVAAVRIRRTTGEPLRTIMDGAISMKILWLMFSDEERTQCLTCREIAH